MYAQIIFDVINYEIKDIFMWRHWQYIFINDEIMANLMLEIAHPNMPQRETIFVDFLSYICNQTFILVDKMWMTRS